MKTPTILLLLGTVTTAAAQPVVRFGVRVGGNYATTSEKGPTQSSSAVSNVRGFYSKSPLFAGQVGVVVEVAWNHFAFQPALLFSQKGTVIKATSIGIVDSTGYEQRREGETTARYNWLELPLNVVYNLPGKTGLQVFAGPYVAVGVGGKALTVINNSTNDPNNPVQIPVTKFGDKIDYDPSAATLAARMFTIRGYSSRRVDAGFNVGIGYRQGPLRVQASYGMGLVNLNYDAVTGYNSQSGYNRVAQLTGTYFFD